MVEQETKQQAKEQEEDPVVSFCEDSTTLTIHFSGLCLFVTECGAPEGKEIVPVLLLEPGATGTGVCRHDPAMSLPRGAIRRAHQFHDQLTISSPWAEPHRFSTVFDLCDRRVQFLPETMEDPDEWDLEGWDNLLSLKEITGQSSVDRNLLDKAPVPGIVSAVFYLPPGKISTKSDSTATEWFIAFRAVPAGNDGRPG